MVLGSGSTLMSQRKTVPAFVAYVWKIYQARAEKTEREKVNQKMQ